MKSSKEHHGRSLYDMLVEVVGGGFVVKIVFVSLIGTRSALDGCLSIDFHRRCFDFRREIVANISNRRLKIFLCNAMPDLVMRTCAKSRHQQEYVF